MTSTEIRWTVAQGFQNIC